MKIGRCFCFGAIVVAMLGRCECWKVNFSPADTNLLSPLTTSYFLLPKICLLLPSQAVDKVLDAELRSIISVLQVSSVASLGPSP